MSVGAVSLATTSTTPTTSTSSTSIGSTAPATAPPLTPAGFDGIRPGYYLDGSTDIPHYVLTVTTTPTGFSGWLFFVYQDGRVSEVFHYHSTHVTADLLMAVSMVTDDPSQPFPFNNPPPFPQAGTAPIPPGRAFTDVYGGTTTGSAMSLGNCAGYLYWANPAHTPRPLTCSFTYNGTSTW